MIEMNEAQQRYYDKLIRELADSGKLIEAGWVGLRVQAIPPDASVAQLDDMRMAFMAGAQHLWGSIIGMLEGGEDATEVDLSRMDKINKELEVFAAELETVLRAGR